MTKRIPQAPPHLRLVADNETGGPARQAGTNGPNMRDVDWSILMARAQDGDEVAYKTLLNGIVPYIRSLARRQLRSAADAEDAVQDVLITIHMLRATYDPHRPFGPWLKAIANRKIIDRDRSLKRFRRKEVELTDDHLELPVTKETIEGQPNRPDVTQLLSRLPRREAEALRMTKLQGLSLEQASASSGQSISAIKVATHRAINRLKRMLGEEQTDEH